MANRITYDARPDLPDIRMSNGLTSVFMDVLTLAASSLASTVRELEIAAWIASKDQGVYGPGTVGFDIADIPWDADPAEEQAFLLRSITAARSKIGWDKLGYDPDESLLMPCLDGFQALLTEFRPDDIRIAAAMIGTAPSSPSGFECCPVHGVVRHAHGCPLCNG
jgi:hypothetical protein